MEKKIARILKGIYEIDPGLKDREKEIVPIIENIREAELDFDPDEEFVFELRKELLAKTEATQGGKKIKMFKKNRLDIKVLLVAIFVFVILLTANNLHRGEIDIKKMTSLSSKVMIAEVGGNAFGTLSDLSVQQNSANNSYGKNISSQSGSRQEFATTDSVATAPASIAPAATPSGMGGGVSSDAKIVSYRPVYYSYVYKGIEFSQDSEKMSVLKRVAGGNISAGDIIHQINLGLFDFSRLDNSKIALVSLLEDKDYGYRADVDLVEGYVSVYKNWLKWPNVYADCKDGSCYQSRRIKAEDVPSDSEVISGCNNFLDAYGIDRSSYGEPEIEKQYTNYYKVADAEIVYPEEISVVYPLKIDEKGVYENSGGAFGLSLSFDVRSKKVSSVNNLRTNNYQSSIYDAETDIQKILAKAQNIDGNMPLSDDKSVDFKKVDLELDTPVLGYEHLWRYENGKSSEFMVPCFVFPIKENPDVENSWRKQIVIPIIKDFLNEENSRIAVPMPADTTIQKAMR